MAVQRGLQFFARSEMMASGTPGRQPEDRRARPAAPCAAPRRRPLGLASTSSATDAACGCDPQRCRACATCRRSARLSGKRFTGSFSDPPHPRHVPQELSLRHRCSEWPLGPSRSSSPDYEDGSAWSFPYRRSLRRDLAIPVRDSDLHHIVAGLSGIRHVAKDPSKFSVNAPANRQTGS
jgi:hypothetical protein